MQNGDSWLLQQEITREANKDLDYELFIDKYVFIQLILINKDANLSMNVNTPEKLQNSETRY